MIRRPPRSTLFPYTRSPDLVPEPAEPERRHREEDRHDEWKQELPAVPVEAEGAVAEVRVRSEEHTSELQSRLHLVCRPLLEKKKTRPRRTQREHMCASLGCS